MSTRLRVILVVLLVLAGGSAVLVVQSLPSAPPSHSGPSTDKPDSAQLTKSPGAAQCRGLTRDDVRGPAPAYSRKQLAGFPNDRRLCHGIWLPKPRRLLVPQGLAISGRTAWISGFRFHKGYGERPCQLVRVDITTGRRLAFHSAVYGRVGDRPRTYCRHGGGIVQQGRYLWLVEKNKLWLVDPSQPGDVLNATRVWAIHAPARGSSIVADSERIGLVPYQNTGAPRIYWYSLKRLLEPGVLDLGASRAGSTQLGPISSTRVPRFVQGATLDTSGRLYLTRSNLRCGELVTPSGRRVSFMPGAEGIQFASDGQRLWTVSESGASPYAGPRKPLTPALSSFSWPGLLRGQPASCGFAAY